MTDKRIDIRITIGGDAGQGGESSAAGFAKALSHGGLHVFMASDFRSRIRGGHNFQMIRASDRPVRTQREPFHMLLALTPETIERHKHSMIKGGAILYDEGFRGVDTDELEELGIIPMPLPLVKLAEEHGGRVLMNTAVLGAAAGLLEFPIDHLEGVIKENFQKKGDKIVEGNLAVCRAGYDLAQTRYGDLFSFRLPEIPNQPKRMITHANNTFSLGALAGGCRFISAYPMTPATTVIEYMAATASKTGVVTKHVEDEIAAICMAIGANYAGARAMTATSGGGFSLMVEALGMSGMLEVPLVVFLSQRGGPSTGLPTRTEQSDLLFAVHASHGEFPRIVLAPGTHEEMFEAGWRAFNLAEKYQCPVVVLSDLWLSGSLTTIEWDALSLDGVVIDRGRTLTNEELDALTEDYRRFAPAEDGISPRAIPGHPNAVYTVATDEHNEFGLIDEEQDVRIRMQGRRMSKLETAAEEDMRAPNQYGPETAEISLLAWGSMLGPALEAMEIMNEERPGQANLFHFIDLWPLPVEKVKAALSGCKQIVVVEQNYTGQLARLLRMTTGIQADQNICKWDGRKITPDQIVAAVKEELAHV